MSQKQEWKDQIMAQFKSYYGELKHPQLETINRLLDDHWELCKKKLTYNAASFIALPSGILLSNFVDLSNYLPAGVVAAVFGRSVFTALSYFATAYLITELHQLKAFEPIFIPLLQKLKLEEKHLQDIFKKCETPESLVKFLQGVNQDIQKSMVTDEKARKASAVGAAAGSLVTAGLFHPRDRVLLAQRGAGVIATAGAFTAPTLFFRRRHDPLDINGTPTTWEKDLKKPDISQNSGNLRRRAPMARGGGRE